MRRLPINIIIADDSKDFIEAFTLRLSRNKDYKIIDICYNGKELVESQHLHCAHVVISDIEMPLLNGIQAAKKINWQYPKLPLIALSMYKERIYLIEIIGAGFSGFIYKPDVSTTLFDTISDVLNKKFTFPTDIKLQ